MIARESNVLCTLLALAFTAISVSTAAAPPRSLDTLPLSFEPNRGQVAEQVAFLAHMPGYGLQLNSSEARFVTADATDAPLTMKLIGADPRAAGVGLDPLPGSANYFIGKDPRSWRTGIPTFARVEFRGIYPGVDIAYHGTRGQVEFDLIVAPGADPAAVTIAFESADGLEIGTDGDLVVRRGTLRLLQRKPEIFQIVRGRRRTVDGGWILAGDRVKFRVESWDRTLPLVIDPQLVYSTYLGGTGSLPADRRDEGRSIAVDSAGNAYVTGSALSTNFPTTAGAFKTTDPDSFTILNAADAFVSKINAAGTALVYSTYLGGFGRDEGYGIAVDKQGNAYVTGFSRSNDFPTANALQPSNRGGFVNEDAFVTKLNAAGNQLIYSTYLGGGLDPDGFGGNDQGRDIAVDGAGNAYVTGKTSSANFPTANAIQPGFGGDNDVFVTELNAAGSALVYSTFLGGSDVDEAYAMTVDATGNAYVTGLTSSTNFPTANALQPSTGGGFENQDAFVAKLSAGGTPLVYSTYLGGSGEENPFGNGGIAVDPLGNAYVTGQTNSDDFPTKNAFQPTKGGGSATFSPDAFVAKINASGSALVYSTYLGGALAGDGGNDITADSAGRAYVTGFSTSTDFPTVKAVQSTFGGGGSDIFVAIMNPAGSALLFSTFLGGGFDDIAYDITLDGSGNVYVTGLSASNNFPTVTPLQASNAGGFDAVISKIRPDLSSDIKRRRAVRK
jgi:hypothetical protein